MNGANDPYDILIRGGTLIDGTGASRRVADVGIRGERIAAVGELTGHRAEHEIDARGRVVAPGFIDVHSHDDRSLLSNCEMMPKLSQGVTTVVTGNCGLSLAPLQSQQPPAPLNLAGGGQWYRFADFASYLTEVESKSPAINAAPLVGHSTLRVGALDDFTRPAREAGIRLMKERLRAALEAGALGFSTGLFYPPNRPAPLAEVVALAEELPAFGGIYTTHMRDEGDQVLASLEETFETGRRAQVPVVISHLKCASPKVWGTSGQVLARIEAARRQQAVGFDVYPNLISNEIQPSESSLPGVGHRPPQPPRVGWAARADQSAD